MRHVSLLELRKTLGEDMTTEVLSHAGGLSFYVPAPSNRLVSGLSTPALQELSKHFGGERCSFPRAPQTDRKEALVELFSQGVSVAEAARQAKCSERYAFIIKKRCLGGGGR